MKQEIEIWKDIEGFEGLYQVSSMGRVKSLWFGKEKIMKPICNRFGYLNVAFYKDGKRKQYLIHRLVAMAFIPNHQNLLEINHKDENKQNNCISNLEWCTQEYNLNYGTRRERAGKSLSITQKGRILSQKTKDKISMAHKSKKLSKEHIEKISKSLQKPILQFSKDGKFIKEWASATQVERELNIVQTCICNCCKGRLKTYKGYIWKYASEYEKIPFKIFDLEIYRKKAS